MSTQTTTTSTLRQRVFKNYQRMLTFTINLCYRDIDYSVELEGTSYKVKYLA